MPCKSEIAETRQVTNEFVAYRIVCCREECCKEGCKREGEHVCCVPEAHTCESSWHTVSVHRDDHELYLAERHKEVEQRHSKMKAWRKKQKQ